MQPAGFWIRFIAYVIDMIIIMVVVYGGGALLGFDLSTRAYFSIGIDAIPDFYYRPAREIATLVWFVYGAAFEASATQATIGKMLAGIKVTNNAGLQIGFSKSLLRNFAKIISILPFLLGFIWVAFSSEKKAWHDSLAKARVYKGP